MKFFYSIILIVAASIVSIAPASAQESVKVGVIYALTGGSGPQGADVVRSIEAMSEIINENGGVLGKKIELIIGDHQSTPAVAASRASEMVNKNVSVVIEGMGSPFSLAMQPILARAGILDITAASKSDTILTGGANPLAVLVNSSNLQDGQLAADFIIKNNLKKIAFLIQNDVYGNTGQSIIEKFLKERKFEYQIVAQEKFPYTQIDFRVPLTNIKNARPDVTILFNGNMGSGLPAVIRQAKQLRLEGSLFAAVSILVPSVIATAGDAANGWYSGGYYFSNSEPFVSNPINKRLVQKLKISHNIAPDEYMAVGAAALQIWAMAANELRTLDRERIANRIRGGGFNGTVLGDIKFAPNGQLETQQYIYTVKNGKQEVLK